jgi:hypothetical protein
MLGVVRVLALVLGGMSIHFRGYCLQLRLSTRVHADRQETVLGQPGEGCEGKVIMLEHWIGCADTRC